MVGWLVREFSRVCTRYGGIRDRHHGVSFGHKYGFDNTGLPPIGVTIANAQRERVNKFSFIFEPRRALGCTAIFAIHFSVLVVRMSSFSLRSSASRETEFFFYLVQRNPACLPSSAVVMVINAPAAASGQVDHYPSSSMMISIAPLNGQHLCHIRKASAISVLAASRRTSVSILASNSMHVSTAECLGHFQARSQNKDNYGVAVRPERRTVFSFAVLND